GPASSPTEFDPPSPRVSMMIPHWTSYLSCHTPQGVVKPASSSGWAQMPMTSILFGATSVAIEGSSTVSGGGCVSPDAEDATVPSASAASAATAVPLLTATSWSGRQLRLHGGAHHWTLCGQ